MFRIFLGFGKFNWKISILGALIFMNAAISISSASFIIPAAVCDFQLKTVDKGRIVIFPLLGKLSTISSIHFFVSVSNHFTLSEK